MANFYGSSIEENKKQIDKLISVVADLFELANAQNEEIEKLKEQIACLYNPENNY